MIEPSTGRQTPMKMRIAAVCLFYLSSSGPALAYVDPGTGSMLLQLAAAGIAGALFYFREIRLQFVDWFRRMVLRRGQAAQHATPVATSTAQDVDPS